MSELLLPEVEVDVPDGGLPIGEAARVTGLGVETLRYYERAGLLLDPAPRNSGGKRRYGRRDLNWIAGLVMLRETGMSIADMHRIAEISRRPGTERERLVAFEEHRTRVVADLERTRRHLAAIDRKIAAYREAASAVADDRHAGDSE